MQNLQNYSHGISASALLTFLAASQPVLGQSEFTMPASPTNDVSADFAGVPAENLRFIYDPLGDTPKLPNSTTAWDLMTISVAYDRLTKELWMGVEVGSENGIDPVDFGTPDGPEEQPNLGIGEFLTGAIDLNNDSVFDLWFGIVPFGNESAFSTAPFVEDPNGDGSTLNDYLGSGGFAPPATSLLGISPWVSTDESPGSSGFEFMIDLDAHQSMALLLPDTSTEETVFNLQFDTGNSLDTYGEDRAIGTVSFDAIPEPSSAALAMLGLCLGLRRKRQA